MPEFIGKRRHQTAYLECPIQVWAKYYRADFRGFRMQEVSRSGCRLFDRDMPAGEGIEKPAADQCQKISQLVASYAAAARRRRRGANSSTSYYGAHY